MSDAVSDANEAMPEQVNGSAAAWAGPWMGHRAPRVKRTPASAEAETLILTRRIDAGLRRLPPAGELANPYAAAAEPPRQVPIVPLAEQASHDETEFEHQTAPLRPTPPPPLQL